MLSVIFVIAVILVTFKLLVGGIKAAWGIAKVLCTLFFFPALVIGLFVVGLVYIAVPILIIGALGSFMA